MASEQISLVSLFAILVVSGLVVRWMFFSSGSTRQAQAPHGGARRGVDREALMRSREAAVERIQQMFPQVERRTLLWDLQRNGGNIQATTERILSGRLETPPVTFQPLLPPGATAPSSPSSQQTKQPDKPAQPDLITRYKLQDKVASSSAQGSTSEGGSEAATTGAKKAAAWSANKDERQALLQRRREEMILAARRKMEAKIAAEKAIGSSS